MKTELISPKFEPFSFSITVETPEELQSLWHRFNINFDAFNSTYTNRYVEKNKSFNLLSCNSVYILLDEQVKIKSVIIPGYNNDV